MNTVDLLVKFVKLRLNNIVLEIAEIEHFWRGLDMIPSNVSQLEVSGVKLRDVVLRCIQSDFKSKK
jgi:hypothetical protein